MKNTNISKETEKEICELYSSISTKELSTKFNISVTKLYQIIKSNNIPLKQKISKEIELQICEDYQDVNISLDEIAKKYNTCTSSIDNIRNRHNIPNRAKPKLECDIRLQICNEYNRNADELAIKYSVDRKTILRIIEYNNISTKKYQVNENFFEKLDNKESLYFAGLLSADGHLDKDTYNVSILLKSTDVDILEKFKIALKSNHPIHKYSRFDDRTNKTYLNCKLDIHREKLYTDLVKHGISNTKSSDLRIPIDSIPPHMMHYYLRGWSDGDAGWTIDKNNNLSYILVSSSIDYLSDLKNIFEKECNLSNINILDYRPKMNCFKLRYCGNLQTRKIFDYLYQGDLEPKLNRKYNYCKQHFYNLDNGIRSRNVGDPVLDQCSFTTDLRDLQILKSSETPERQDMKEPKFKPIPKPRSQLEILLGINK